MTTAGDPNAEPTAVVSRMRADLTAAMRARDAIRVRALRTALAAIANAEAPAVDLTSGAGGAGGAGSPPPPAQVGRLVEHLRLVLGAADIDAVLRDEIDDRHDTIAQLAPHHRDEEIDELRREIGVLEPYLLS